MAIICPKTAIDAWPNVHRKIVQLLPMPASMTPDYGDILYRPCPLKLTPICSRVD